MFSDLPTVLRAHADRDSDRLALTFAPAYLGMGRTELSFGQLDHRSRVVAAELRRHLGRGDRALILLPAIPEFGYAFLGCLAAGVVAVPLPVPADESSARRVLNVARDSTATAVLSTSVLRQFLTADPRFGPLAEKLTWIDIDTIDLTAAGDRTAGPIDPNEIAFLQYTSGSTRAPRGVVVTHGCLAHNEAAIQDCFGVTAGSAIVSWLPLHHDMGLIGALLQPLYTGARAVLLDPLSFLERPASWLEEISAQGADISGGPNFAYDLCARKVTDEEKAKLDLSSWRIAFNGAAPVSPASLRRFSEAFAGTGFRPSAHTPCYGLAETTLLVASADATTETATRTFDVAALEAGRATPGADRELITYRTLDHATVRIADPATGEPVADGTVGEIWVAGGSNGHGYWADPAGSVAVFGATLPGSAETHVRTGDLGFADEGDLYVTGRLKDLVIYRGRNLHPEDMEADLPVGRAELRPGCAAVFAVPGEGEERVVACQEVRTGTGEERYPELARHIRQVLSERYGVTAHTVVLLPPGAITKTSSGKVQRFEAGRRFRAGTLPALWTEELRDPAAGAVPLADLVGEGFASAGPDDRAERLTGALCAYLRHALGSTGPVDPGVAPTALGVDSLLAVTVQHEIEALLGTRLKPSLALRATSLEALARAALGQERTEPAVLDRPADGYELTENQRALWFLQHTAPDSFGYNVTRAFTVSGPVDLDRLGAALTAVVAAHESLRLNVRVEDGRPAGHVAPAWAVEPEVVDASDWPEQRVRDWIGELSVRPFDLAADRLIRAAVLRRDRDVIVLSLHHIVCDMFSLTVILQQLAAAYGGASLPAAPVRPRPADLERAALAVRDDELTAFWLDQLDGELPVLALPSSTHRRGWTGDVVGFDAAPELSDRLARIARDGGLTLHNLLLAAFQMLLHRISGQADVVVGVPVAGRADPALTGYVGYLVNVLPIRSRLAAGTRFADLAEATQHTMLDALDHQELPFPLLTQRLNPDRGTGAPPVSQAMFSYYSTAMPGARTLFGDPAAALPFGAGALSGRPVDDRTSQSDLGLSVAELGDRLTFGLQYDTTLLPRWQVEQFRDVFLALLTAVAADPGADVTRLPLVDEAATADLLALGAGPRPARTEHYLAEFARQVRRTPDAVAVEDGTTAYGYAELNERANHVAERLLAAGAGLDTNVVVSAERSTAFLAVLLGIHKAGACYVPVSPGEAPRRAERMLAALRPPVIVADESGRAAMSSAPAPVLDLDDLVDGRRADDVVPDVSPLHSGYIIHTSGSTGTPKAAVVTAGGLTNHLWQMIEYFGIDAADCIGQTGPATFDISVWQYLAGLLVGARTRVVADRSSRSPARLKEAVVSGGITILEVVPAVVGALLDEGLAGEPHRLRSIIPTGETVTWDVVHRWYEACPRVPLYNAYGPAECADDVTISLIGRDATGGDGGVPIGRPLANTTVHLLDGEFNPVPRGMVGALYVGGAGVGRGYLGDPARTAEVFVPDPYAPQPGARLYRTGDLARFTVAGELEFMGRVDRQVKMRGMRIELGEVETALRNCPAVLDAVAKVHESERGMSLVAYLVQEGGGEPRQLVPGEYEAVRLALTESLPRHMIPTVFVRIGELPRLRTGKVDYGSLRYEQAPPEAAAELSPAQLADPVVTAVRKIWSELLEREAIGWRDNFFLLGGHSLLALKMTDQVSRALSVELDVDAIFANPGLNEFVAAVRRAAPRQAAPAAIPRIARTRAGA